MRRARAVVPIVAAVAAIHGLLDKELEAVVTGKVR